MLVEVLVRTVEYWEGPGSWIGKSIAFLIARVTKSEGAMGDNKVIRVRKGAPKKRAATKQASKTVTKKVAKETARKAPKRVARP